MSFKLSTLIYWMVILIWVTCNADTGTNGTTPTNKTVLSTTPAKKTVINSTDVKTSSNVTVAPTKISTTGVKTSSNVTVAPTKINTTDVKTSSNVTVAPTKINTTAATKLSTKATPNVTATVLPTNSTPTIPSNKTEPPTTSAPIPTPTTPIPSKLRQLLLIKKELTARSVKVEWKRDPSSNTSDSFELSVELRIENGAYNKTVSINSSAGIPGEHTFDNLTPYSNYTLTCYEVLKNERGPAGTLVVQTSQAAPSIPRNLKVTRSERTIEIKWDAPAMRNGKIVKYIINHTFSGKPGAMYSKELSAKNQRNYTIVNLYPYVYYTIYVQEKTVAYSPPATIRALTLKAEPFGPPVGIHINDTVPFSIEHNSKVKVRVSWKPLPQYYMGDDYIEYIVSGLGKQIYTNRTFSEHILDVYTSYQVKISSGNSKGVSKKESPMPFRTRQRAPSKPRSVLLTPIRDINARMHSINVSWIAPEYVNGKPSKFKYNITKSCSTHRCKRRIRRQESFSAEIDLDDPPRRVYEIKYMWGKLLDPYSTYVVTISERTCKNCWGNNSDSETVTTLPGVPTQPQGLHKSNIDSSSMVISWKRPLYPNGRIERYDIILKKDSASFQITKTKIATVDEDYHETFEDLDSETEYTIEISAINEGNIRGKEAIISFRTYQSRTWLFILIGCLVVVLIVVLILSTYLLVSRRRRHYKAVKSNDDMELKSGMKSKVIPVANFKNYCAQHHANSDHGFQQEYETLRVPVRPFTWEHSSLACNQVKNRYSNIVAYDHSRVILEVIDDDPSSTYINANYIDGYLREKQYIATQGPLPETIIDFWRMIWDQNVPIIVSLTKLIEDNKLKCEQYWPEGKAMQYRDVVVTIMSVKELTDMTVKVLKLHKINNPELGTREVRHFHYTAWPDHGVPGHPTSMLSFIRHVMSYFPKETTAPVVVHCSAGVGRTGTFIAIEGCLRQMENDTQVDVFGTVLRMRMQRNFMVQTESQYTFIYDALLDNAVCGNTEISPENLVARMKYLNEQEEQSGETHFVAEFKRLESGFKLKDKEQFTDASHPENKAKNRFLNILPFDKNRIRLSPVAGSRQSDYINASIIDGFQQKHAFIATQAPLENTVADFWRMVLEQNVNIIVMLTKIEEKGQEKCYLYWPQAGMVSYGSVHVEVVNVRNQDDVYIIHDLRITNRETGKSWPVTHFLYLGWPEYHGSPDSGTDLIHFIGLVEKTQRSLTDAGPTLVHCSGGVGRTGVFITVFNSVERLKAKNIVDVFQTTRALRLQRSAMVQTIDQYKFCYQCLKDYLDSFDLFANPEC